MRKFVFTLLIACIAILTHGQTLVNQAISDTLPFPIQYREYARLMPDGAGNTIVMGNTYSAYPYPGSENFKVVRVSASGISQRDFAALHDGRDFGTAGYVRGDNAYIAGITLDSTGTRSVQCHLMRLSIAAFDTIWTRTIQLDSAVPQAPFAIVAGDSAIYMGCAVLTQSSTKVVVVKYDLSGTVRWTSTYDSSGVFTVPVGMALSGSHLCITGFTLGAQSDFVTIHMNSATGALGSVAISPNGAGLPSYTTGIATDSYHHTFISGTSTIAGSASVVKTICYDSLFHQEWVAGYGDSSGTTTTAAMYMDDPFTADPHLVMTGSEANSSGGRDLLTLRYSTTGTLAWSRRLSAPDPTRAMSGVAITTDGPYIYVAGTQAGAGDTAIVTAAYDTAGTLLWMKSFSRAPGTRNVPYSIISDGTDVLVSAGSAGADSLYLILKYEQMQMPLALDSDSTSRYIDGQVLVRFNPAIINTSFVDDKDKLFEQTDKVISGAILDSLSVRFGVDLRGSILTKMVPSLRRADSISISRTGDTVVVPKFWSSMILSGLTSSMSRLQLSDLRNRLDTAQPYVFYADYNHVGTFDLCNSNDPLYSNMKALEDPTYDDDINWCPVLNDGQFGKPNIKIGIYDSGVNSAHEDLQYNGTTKIAGGTDYTFNTPILTNVNSDQYGHGTALTGIIAAKIKNNKGVTGVVGGDNSNSGCTIYCNKIGNLSAPTISTSVLYNGIISDASSNGLSLNVANHSYHYAIGDMFMHDAFRFSARNGVVNSCASGNDGQLVKYYLGSYTNLGFTIRVGANDSTGNWAETFSTGGGSTYGNVDLIAPGLYYQYKVLSSTNNSAYGNTIDNGTRIADGTSFSTAFVSGAAGLILSKGRAVSFNSGNIVTLAPEDVKNILKYKATHLQDVSGNLEDKVGAGRLNIGRALDSLSYPQFKVRHYEITPPMDAVPVKDSSFIHLSFDYETDPADTTTRLVKAGTYQAYIYKFHIDYPLALASSETILASWPLPNQSEYWGAKHPNLSSSVDLDPDPLPYTFLNPSTSRMEMTGYVYHITKNRAGDPLNVWVPFHIDSFYKHHMAFSLWTSDASVTSAKDLYDNVLQAHIYPSPTTSIINVDYSLSYTSTIEINISDISGRLILHQSTEQSEGWHSNNINLETVSSGIYFCEIKSNSAKYICKFVKQ